MNCGQAWSTVGEVKEASKLKPEDIVAVIANGIDQAVKAACAQKDAEIERLKAQSKAYCSQAECYERTLECIWDVVGRETDNVLSSVKEQLAAKDQRIAELQEEIRRLREHRA